MMQTTTIKVILPDGMTSKKFKQAIKFAALIRGMNSQEFATLAIQNELSAKQSKQESK